MLRHVQDIRLFSLLIDWPTYVWLTRSCYDINPRLNSNSVTKLYISLYSNGGILYNGATSIFLKKIQCLIELVCIYTCIYQILILQLYYLCMYYSSWITKDQRLNYLTLTHVNTCEQVHHWASLKSLNTNKHSYKPYQKFPSSTNQKKLKLQLIFAVKLLKYKIWTI